MKKTKVLFVLPDLIPGGAERIVVNIANNLPVENYECVIALLKYTEHSFAEQLSENIKIENLKLSRFRHLILKPWIFLRLIKKVKPIVVFSAYGELNPLVVLFSYFFPKIRFIARETSIPSLRYSRWVLIKATKILYGFFDKIIVQSEYMYSDLQMNFNINSEKLILIRNMVDTDKIDSYLTKSNFLPRHEEKIRILYVGSITKQKGVMRVLNYFDQISEIRNGLELIIVGDGPLYSELKEVVSRSRNQSSIFLYAYDKNPYKYMANSDFLIIASDYEGFPNVGLEANYCGLPLIVSSQTKGGAHELIIKNMNGIIVDLGECDLPYLKVKFNPKLIRNHILEKYSAESIIEDYKKLFQNLNA